MADKLGQPSHSVSIFRPSLQPSRRVNFPFANELFWTPIAEGIANLQVVAPDHQILDVEWFVAERYDWLTCSLGAN